MEKMIFVGFNHGRFETENGKKQDYCNVFVLEDFSGDENDDYHFSGQKAMKYGCVSPDVFKGIKLGEEVNVFFDSKKKVSYMVPAAKA